MTKLWTNCSTLERIFIIFSFVILFSSITILVSYDNIFRGAQVHPDNKIAVVVSSTNSIRRRIPMSYGFNILKEGDIIGSGDSIFSGEGSQVMVKFLKGSRLIIGEQSLVVLRELDGKIDVKIEKGGISGALEAAEEIQIQAEDDAVTINGEKESQFSVFYKPGLGMEVIGFEKNINVKFRGHEVNLKNKKAFVSNKTGMQTSKKSSNPDGKEAREPASKKPQADPPPPALPKGMAVEKAKKHSALTLGAPFPSANQVFLHSKGGTIPVFPKEQCIDSCTLKILINGKPGLVKSFKKHTVPLVYLKIETNIQAEVSWVFQDGKESINGSFSVLQNNEVSFGKALKEKRQIEVIN